MQTDINKNFPGIRSKDSDGTEKLNFVRVLLVSAYLAAASAFIPAVLFSPILHQWSYIYLLLSVALPAAGLALCAKLTASVKTVVPFIIITAVIMFFSADLGIAAILPLFVMTAVLAACLLRERCVIGVILASVISYLLAFLLTSSLFLSAMSLIFLPASIALFVSFKKGKHRVETVCTMTLSVIIPLVLSLVINIFISEGSFSVDAIKSFIETFRTELISELSRILTTTFSDLYSQLGEDPSTSAAIGSLPELAAYYVNYVFNYLPAFLTISLFVISYVAHSLYISVIEPTVTDKSQIKNSLFFHMSVVSAVVFILSIIAMNVLYANKLYSYSVAVENIYAILFPGFALTTFGFVGSLLKTRYPSCLGTILYFGLFMLIFVIPQASSFIQVLCSLAGIAGAVIVIFTAIREKIQKNDQNNTYN